MIRKTPDIVAIVRGALPRRQHGEARSTRAAPEARAVQSDGVDALLGMTLASPAGARAALDAGADLVAGQVLQTATAAQ